MVIDPREAQVLERRWRELRLAMRSAAAAGSTVPVAHLVEQLLQVGRWSCARRVSVTFVESRPYSIIIDRCCAGRSDRMTPAETLILVTYFFVLSHPGRLRLAPVLPGVSLHEAQGQGAGPGGAARPRCRVVTIQLPIYNEMYVADRLIDAVCADRLSARAARDPGARRLDRRDARRSPSWRCARHAAQGIDIKYIHRTDRTGFKAGALEAGLKVAKGEFVAIFDADFIPTPDFLERTVPLLRRPEGRRWCRRAGATSTTTTRC